MNIFDDLTPAKREELIERLAAIAYGGPSSQLQHLERGGQLGTVRRPPWENAVLALVDLERGT